jgi:Pyruvate/2-oxoacid:ferredoxin oxidoreductase delta subunit
MACSGTALLFAFAFTRKLVVLTIKIVLQHSSGDKGKAVPQNIHGYVGWDRRYSSYSFTISALDGGSGQHHGPAAIEVGISHSKYSVKHVLLLLEVSVVIQIQKIVNTALCSLGAYCKETDEDRYQGQYEIYIYDVRKGCDVRLIKAQGCAKN